MNNWIEEAERRQALKSEIVTDEEKLNDQRRKENHKRIKVFVDHLNGLIDRAAALPLEEREPSIELGHTHLVGEDKYEFFGSAYWDKPIGVLGKKVRFLCWRRIHLRISDRLGYVKVNVYEKFLPEKKGQKKETKKSKYIFKQKGLTEEVAMYWLDWMVFRIETQEMKDALPRSNASKKNEDKRCFIATAAFEDVNAPEVVLFRKYRDAFLLNHLPGRSFVNLYYLFSPGLARIMDKNVYIKEAIKKLILRPLLAFVS